MTDMKIKPIDEIQAWLYSLEMERTSTSWKTPKKPEVIERVLFKTVKIKRDDRDKLFYHAGRYAEGARDKQAVEANKQIRENFEG